MPGAKEAFLVRDTDADWRELGVKDPYWGVISHPKFRRENLTPEALDEFYASGRDFIDQLVKDLAWLTGKAPSGRALDFGCGVGRLAEGMTRYAQQVTGYDISPGMLDLARQRGGRANYVDALPDGPFDWINSFIVLQHIAPERGEAIIADLLARLAPEGVVSLQVTVWRDARHEPPPADALRRLVRPVLYRRWLRRQPAGYIHMFDYDLSRVVRLLNLAGIEDMRLISTNHDGHHGVIILGRKGAQPASS
jgi:SAM-dependent methyltransferase